MKKRFFISNTIEKEKLPFIAAEEMKFGRAHYSWKIVADLYHQGLEAAGMEMHRVIRPEIYQSEIAQKTFGIRHDDSHIAVKPIEHIRPFYGMKNIFISGWEFPQFSNTPFNNNPLNDHINIMKHADEIWCWSNYTTTNLNLHGIQTAITIPPPVIVPRIVDSNIVENLGTLALNTARVPAPTDIKMLEEVLITYKKSKIFLTVLNPFDKRKQIKLMLSAFTSALSKNQNMILIVKLVIDNISTTLGNIQEILHAHHDFYGKNDRIIFIGETLSHGQMMKLMQKADFYLCTSSTEGLNLPMIEAMSLGVVPISSKATAMADYIHSQNAIVLDVNEKSTDGAYHSLHQYLPTTHFPPRLASTINALTSAANMSDRTYKSLSNQAQKDAREKYSLQAFISNVTAIGAI